MQAPGIAGGRSPHIETPYTRDGVTLHHGDALELYREWPEPVCIISDGAYGVAGFPRRPADARGPRGVVPAARRGVEREGDAADDALVLEHRGGMGDRSPGPGRARVGVRGLPRLEQGDGAHRGEREHEDPCVSSRS
jgi:hypothetical protein